MKICVRPKARQPRESSERYRRGGGMMARESTTPLLCRDPCVTRVRRQVGWRQMGVSHNQCPILVLSPYEPGGRGFESCRARQ